MRGRRVLSKIVEMINNAVTFQYRPAVYISGGIDSTIILHHLCEKRDKDENLRDPIYTYSAKFGTDTDEIISAEMVARHYDTVHKVVNCSKLIEFLPKILKGSVHPRYNVWDWFLAKEAKHKIIVVNTTKAINISKISQKLK